MHKLGPSKLEEYEFSGGMQGNKRLGIRDTNRG